MLTQQKRPILVKYEVLRRQHWHQIKPHQRHHKWLIQRCMAHLPTMFHPDQQLLPRLKLGKSHPSPQPALILSKMVVVC